MDFTTGFAKKKRESEVPTKNTTGSLCFARPLSTRAAKIFVGHVLGKKYGSQSGVQRPIGDEDTRQQVEGERETAPPLEAGFFGMILDAHT